MKKIVILILIVPYLLYCMSDKELANTINLAGKQRMLTQKMSKEALLVFLGVEPQVNAKKLQNSYELFDKTLNGLIKGDKDLGLVVSNDSEIDKKLKEVEQLWKPFLSRVKEVSSFKNLTDKTFEYIDSNNIPLLKKMNEVVILYAKLGSSGVSKLKMANDINLAGKQRMLTQKIAKDLLLIQLDINQEKASKDLNSSIHLFEKSLKGLYDGDKELKINGTKLPKIRKQLDIVKLNWEEAKPLVSKLLNSKNLNLVKEVMDKLDKSKEDMNKAVELYTKSLNRQKQVMKLNALIDGFMSKKSSDKHLINLAGKQRMLTQRISKLAIECSQSLLPNSCDDLKEYASLYSKTLKGFESGDKELGLNALKSKKSKEKLMEINKLWKTFKIAIDKLAVDTKDKESLSIILNSNLKLLEESNNLVTILEEESSKSVSYIEKAQLKIVNIAGRERMLTQKMTKEFLEFLELKNIDSLKKMEITKELFSTSLNALINGSKKLTLPKVTNPKIKEQLHKVENLWNKIMPIYNKKSLDDKEMVLLLKANLILLKEMNLAVSKIEKSTDY